MVFVTDVPMFAPMIIGTATLDRQLTGRDEPNDRCRRDGRRLYENSREDSDEERSERIRDAVEEATGSVGSESFHAVLEELDPHEERVEEHYDESGPQAGRGRPGRLLSYR
jgi:hypothetical protein